MPTEYIVDDALTSFVEQFLADKTYVELAPIRQQPFTFLAVHVLKSKKDGEAVETSGDVVSIKKLSDLEKAFIQGDYFVVVDHTRWTSCSEHNQKAQLHHAFMSLEVVENKEAEEDEPKFKTRKRKPDVVEYVDTVARFGAWKNNLVQLRENLQRAALAAKKSSG